MDKIEELLEKLIANVQEQNKLLEEICACIEVENDNPV